MLIAVAIGAPLAFLLLLFGCQRRMIYLARAYEPAELQHGVEEIVVQTGQGRQVAFLTAPRRGASAAQVWIVFGGNGALALDWLDFAAAHPRDDTAFLLVDYPGYGLCEGRPTRRHILESARAFADALTARMATAEVGYLGHSIGAAVALDLAVPRPPCRIVMISPFTSLVDMARFAVGWPLCNLALDRFDNRARLSELSARTPRPAVTIIHGSRDDIVPVRMGRELAQSHPDWIAYEEIDGADHNWIIGLAQDSIFAAMNPRWPP